jgi:hypothetical protein
MRTIPELSIDTQTIERLLAALPIGGVVTYRVLSDAIGRDVQGAARGNLYTARRRLLHRERMVFDVLVNDGLKRLDDAGKVMAGRAHVHRAVAQARLARRKTAAVDDFNALPNALKVEHNLTLAQAGVMVYMAGPQGTTQLQTKIATTPQPLALAAVLDAMRATTMRKKATS